MNATLALPQGIEPLSISQLFPFVGLSSKKSSEQLAESTERLFKDISRIVDDILVRSIERRTAKDFVEVRDALFEQYMRTLRAMSDLARIVVPERVLDVLICQSFSEHEAELRDEGLKRFGAAVRDQAIFTVWTLRKIHDLIPRTQGKKPDPADKKTDQELAMEFCVSLAFTQFHLDCLSAAIRFDKPLFPEVLDEITDGLRAAVNAYAVLRQGIDLRTPRLEPTFEAQEWDEEDQELLSSSMHDLESEKS